MNCTVLSYNIYSGTGALFYRFVLSCVGEGRSLLWRPSCIELVLGGTRFCIQILRSYIS